jgi:hypothetical protein
MPGTYSQDPDETTPYTLDLFFWLKGRTVVDAVIADITPPAQASAPMKGGRYVSTLVSGIVQGVRHHCTIRVTAGAEIRDFTITIDGRKR